MLPAVSCEGLGKRYRLQHGPLRMYRYQTLRDALAGWLGRLRFRALAHPREAAEEFWALRDLDLAIDPGQVVGIMGANGSGKTTLLKILARVTKPTTGHARLHGRVGSLLEVGAGFHPELTGNENIWLSGAVLGMRRWEIAAKFEEIVEFAEIAPFLDTAVKRYSSGMYIRLAFAVAAHLEPDVLLVDEALAVGDLAFQRKCLGRMQEVGRAGCTVLFVSHHVPFVQSLCGRAVLLDGGRLIRDGEVAEVVHEYQRRAVDRAGDHSGVRTDLGDTRRATPVFRSVALLSELGHPTTLLPLGGRFHVRVGLHSERPIRFPVITIGIDDTLGSRLLVLRTPRVEPVVELVSGRCVLDCRVDTFPLAPGDYWIRLGVATLGQQVDELDRVLRFTVVDRDAFGQGTGITSGLCVAPATWTVAEGLLPEGR